uniref:uncharacterized protein isoform X1 n=1 Tax=Myxine glutinosa TaxID=7769 RepID=UPI00358FBE0B
MGLIIGTILLVATAARGNSDSNRCENETRHLTVTWGQRVSLPCFEQKALHTNWVNINWLALSAGPGRVGMVLQKQREFREDGQARIKTLAQPGYQWGTPDFKLQTRTRQGKDMTMQVRCSVWTPGAAGGEKNYIPCIEYILTPQPQDKAPKRGENTYWKVAREVATIQNRTHCWSCMHFPQAGTTGIHMIVLPLSLNDLCSQPIDSPCLVTTLEREGVDNGKSCNRQFNYRPSMIAHVAERPAPVWVKPQKGTVCLQGSGHLRMGESECAYTLPGKLGQGSSGITLRIVLQDKHNHNIAAITFSRGVSRINGVVKGLQCLSTHLVPPHGTMFICGDKAYPYLPNNWGGTCYLGSVLPDVEILDELDPKSLDRRYKRSVMNEDGTTKLHGSLWEKVFGFFFPGAGTVMDSFRIDKLALALEKVANDTATAHDILLDTVIHMRTMVMQNRVALDMLLAEKGGVCGIIEGKCCTYIPDPSEGVSAAIVRLRETSHALTIDRIARENSYTFSWLTDWFQGWTGTIVKWLLTALAVIIGVVIWGALMKSLVLLCMRKYFTGWKLKKPPTTTMVLTTEAVDLNGSFNKADVTGAPENCIEFCNDCDTCVDPMWELAAACNGVCDDCDTCAINPLRVLANASYVLQADSCTPPSDPTMDLIATLGLAVEGPDADVLDPQADQAPMGDFDIKEVPLFSSNVSDLFDPHVADLFASSDSDSDFYALYPDQEIETQDTDDILYSPEQQHVRDLMGMTVD